MELSPEEISQIIDLAYEHGTNYNTTARDHLKKIYINEEPEKD